MELVDTIGPGEQAKHSRRTLNYLASISYVYIVVPATMLLYWARYLSNHDLVGTGIHLIDTGIATFVGIIYFLLAHKTLGSLNPAQTSAPNLLHGTIPWPRVAFAVATFCTLLWAFSLRVARGAQTPFAFPYASVNRQEVSVRPTSWNGTDEATVTGAGLFKHNLRFLQGARSFLMKSDLRCADLTGADLTAADLRKADFYRTRATRTVLLSANLQGSILFRANFIGADLRSAKLQNAVLSSSEDQVSIEDMANWLSFVLEGIDDKQQPRTEGALCVAPEDQRDDKTPRTKDRELAPKGTEIIGGPGIDDPNAQILETFRDRLDVMDLIMASTNGKPFYTAVFTNAKLTGADLTDAYLPARRLPELTWEAQSLFAQPYATQISLGQDFGKPN